MSGVGPARLHRCMVTEDVLRGWAMGLPGVEEVAEFGLPMFAVAGEPFLAVEKGRTTAIVGVDEWEAGALVAGHHTLYEEVWHNEADFVGLRIDLVRAPEERLRELVTSAWRNKAPRDLVTR